MKRHRPAGRNGYPSGMEGTELLIQQPGAPSATRVYVGRLDGFEGPVIAKLTPEGAQILAVLVDEEAEMAFSELLELLPDNALAVRAVSAPE